MHNPGNNAAHTLAGVVQERFKFRTPPAWELIRSHNLLPEINERWSWRKASAIGKCVVALLLARKALRLKAHPTEQALLMSHGATVLFVAVALNRFHCV